MAKPTKKKFKTLGIKLSEFSTVRDKVQLLKACSFTHPQYGKVVITKKMLADMVETHANNVRGIELMIDYSHNNEGEAAGWIKHVYTEKNGVELWAEVEWTKPGEIALADKKFAYLSAEFEEQYTDNENPDIIHPCVLLGAGLTNRPVIKRMASAILLSEDGAELKNEEDKDLVVFAEDDEAEPAPEVEPVKPSELTEDKLMFQEQDKASLIKLLKILGAGSVDEALLKLETDNTKPETVKPIQFTEGKAMEKTENEKALEAQLQEQNDVIAKYKADEKKNSFDLMLSEGKVVEAQRESFVSGDMAEFAKNAQPIKLAETGKGGNEPKTETPAVDVEAKIKTLAEKEMKDNGSDYSEAVRIVLSENKALKDEYNNKFNEVEGE